jgi:hypothetical protein
MERNKVYEMEYNAKDISELIINLRVIVLRKSPEAFSQMLGIKPETLALVEDGRSAHILKTLEKCIELKLIKDVKLKFEIA